MPRDFKRADRVADAMQRTIADVLRKDIRDPRIGMANINAVKIPNDLSTAKVYVTFSGMDEEERIDEAVAALNDAAGYIRSHVAKEITMRVVPRLFFVYDRVVVEGQQLSNLIDKALADDASKHSSDG